MLLFVVGLFVSIVYVWYLLSVVVLTLLVVFLFELAGDIFHITSSLMFCHFLCCLLV